MKTTDISRRLYWFPCEDDLRNERRKIYTYDALLPRSGKSASDWLRQISLLTRPITEALPRSSDLGRVTRHQCGISAFIAKTSSDRETSGSVTKCRLFSLANSVCHYEQYEMPISIRILAVT